MKVKRFRTPRPLLAAVAQGRTILRGSWSVFRQTKIAALLVALGALLLAALIWPHDRALLDALHASTLYNHAAAHDLAWYLGTFGDYDTYNAPFALILWLIGLATKSTTCRRLAVIAFLGATLAGLFDDGFRLTLGRPRPDTLAHANLQDRFYGPLIALRGGFQSFPSGHAASTFGMAVALLLTEWRLGLLTTFIAAAVVWARLELNRHYPSDVLVGSLIGTYFGLLVGFGAKVRGSLVSGRSGRDNRASGMKAVLILIALALMASSSRADDLALSVAPTQEFFVLGEPIQYEVCITNNSAKQIMLGFDGDMKISTQGPQDGVEIEKPLPSFGGLGICPLLKPGEIYRNTCLLSCALVRIHKPGTFHFDTQVPLFLGDGKGGWGSQVQLSAKLTLMILPPDAQALARKLHALKNALIHDDVVHPSRDHLSQIRLLMSYTTPQSVDVAGEVYSSLMPADENEMIYDAAKNPELGRKYLKKFASETSPNLPGVQQCLAQVRAGLDANEKFQAQAAPASK